VSEQGAVPVSLVRAREQTVQKLCAHFAADHLRVEEFENLLDRSYRASSLEELEGILHDLPMLGAPESTESPLGRPLLPEAIADSGLVIGVFSGPKRQGNWQPPRHLRVVACMGGAELDFRSVRLPPGVTKVTVLALMGGVEIIVPPELSVNTSGLAIMGGFEPCDQIGTPTSDDGVSARLEIRGFAMWGGVRVRQRLEGESAREARRRLKRERKVRRLQRGS